jgi:hypothetical protein
LILKKQEVSDGKFNYQGDVYQVVNKTDKPLAGEVAVMLIDKGFAPKYVSKKYLGQATNVPAPATGKLYHVVI